MVAWRHHGAGALGSSSSGVVRFLVKLSFLRCRGAFAAWLLRPPCEFRKYISQRARSRELQRCFIGKLCPPLRKMVSTSRAKMYQAPPPLSLSCGSKVIREIIARKEGGAWERGYAALLSAISLTITPYIEISILLVIIIIILMKC